MKKDMQVYLVDIENDLPVLKKQIKLLLKEFPHEE